MATPVELVCGDNAATKVFPTAASLTDAVQTYGSNSYINLLNSAAAIKGAAGTFFGFAVGAAGTTITVTVYDSLTASGTIIFGPYVLVAGAIIAMPGGGVAFGVGLSIGFSATTGTPNLTAAYR